MTDDTYRRVAFATIGALAIGASACGGDDAPDPPPGDGIVATRVSRSSSIALSEDGTRLAMVNPDDSTLSIFQTSDHARTAKVPTGGKPSAVAIAPDSKTAYVANRATGTVSRVSNIDSGTPAVDATVDVGAEPVALALSPTGRKLFVAELAESRVSVIDTTTMTVVDSFEIDRPRALLVTNNKDANDDDETLAVTQFFGVPVPGKEAKDDGRIGYVRVYSLADLKSAKAITFAPIDSGFPKAGVPGNPNILTSANQLASIATAQGRLYVTSVAASPEPPIRFDNNVFPVVHVADLASATEVRDASGTTNLARKIVDANPAPTEANPRFIPGELSGIDFVEDSNVGYTIGSAGDVMVRVTFGATVEVGSTQNKQIDLGGNDTIGKCQGPIGLVIDSAAQKAYVNCRITRRLAVVDLAAQSMVQTFESSPPPANGAEASVQKGQRFYFTGRGRWSNAGGNGAKGGEGWSSCGSCHPDGLTDNITWAFNTGPRQTTSQDGSFSHGPGAQKQRIFNWTAIFDRHHDFERNTRDVSGGLGAITTADTLADCNKLDKERQVPLAIDGSLIGGLGKPLKELADDPTVALCGHKDWDDIDNFVKTIAPVQAVRTAPEGAVDRGRAVFVDGGCAKCHGGQGWTVSRRGFTPSGAGNDALAQTDFVRPAFFPRPGCRQRERRPEVHLRAARARRRCDRSRGSGADRGRPGRVRDPQRRYVRAARGCGWHHRARAAADARWAAPRPRVAQVTTCRRCTARRSARRTSTTVRPRRSATCSPTRAGRSTPMPATRTSASCSPSPASSTTCSCSCARSTRRPPRSRSRPTPAAACRSTPASKSRELSGADSGARS
ncbi:MAG: beta-propeller fold lactonase family protein [Kofleriaceae bacterium]